MYFISSFQSICDIHGHLIFESWLLQLQFNLNDSITSVLDWITRFSLAGILVTLLSLYYQRSKEKKNKIQEFNDRINRACKLLLVDIDEFEKSWYDLRVRLEEPFTFGVFNLENYHSVINSGLITYFKRETQGELTKFYHHLELHNRRVFEMSFVANITLSKTNLEEDRGKLLDSFAWQHLRLMLNRSERQIEEKMSTVKNLLNNEIKSVTKNGD